MIDVLKRLAELDSGNPNIIKENQEIEECGIMPQMAERPSMPASINITAGSGEELSDMLSAIMTLAGVHKVGDEHMGAEMPQATLTAEPMTVGEPDQTAADSMRNVIDKMHDAGADGEEETDEGQYDNSPNDPTDENEFDSEEFAHHENQPGGGDAMNGKSRVRNQPTATMEQQLMAEYQKFIAESVPHINSPGSDEWHNVRGDQDYEQFVNGNEPNFKGRYNDNDDKATQSFVNFLKKKGLQVDAIDDRGSPVIVAMCQGKMCAWYDLENAHGYIAPV